MNKPHRYKDVKSTDVPVQVLDALSVAKDTRRGLYIYGPVGSGKTHVAYALADFAEKELHVRVMVQNVTEMLASFRADFDRPWSERERLDQRLDEFSGLLVLDDIGAERPTEWVSETLYRVINRRYNEALPTIYTSNLPLSDLAESIGDRTASRIAGSCDVVELKGEDRRIIGIKKIRV